MTITFGWKHAAVAAALIALAIGLSIWAVKNASQRDALDLERAERIAELEEENQQLQHESALAHEEADELRKRRLALEVPLKRSRGAIQHARKNRPLGPDEEVVILRGQTDLLEEALRLSVEESLALRRSLTLLGMALTASEEKYDLLDKRYVALKREKKSTKRKRVVQQVFTHTGVFVVAWAGGKYSQ